MLITEITDHLQQGLQKLMGQYQGKKYVVGILTAFLNQVQALETAFFPLDAGRQLLTAIGAQLDGMGELINLKRNGLPDNEYLLFILGTIAEDYSDGTITTLSGIVNTLFTPSLLLSYETFPAEREFAVGGSELVNLFGEDSTTVQQAIAIVQNSISGGVRLGSFTISDGTNAFRTCELTGSPAFLSFAVVPTTGQYSLFFGSNASTLLNYNASAATLQAAINALPGLSAVTILGAYNTAGGFTVDWGDGAQVPILVDDNTTGEDILISNSVVISPGSGGGYGDVNNPSAGGDYASAVYTNAGD